MSIITRLAAGGAIRRGVCAAGIIKRLKPLIPPAAAPVWICIFKLGCNSVFCPSPIRAARHQCISTWLACCVFRLVIMQDRKSKGRAQHHIHILYERVRAQFSAILCACSPPSHAPRHVHEHILLLITP